MIKMIVSDLDGTLLPEGTDQLNPEVLDVIQKIRQKGILFVAASGRPLKSIRHVFSAIENDLIFIAENGAYVVCRGYTMRKTVMNREKTEQLIRYFRKKEGYYFTACTTDAVYVETSNPQFQDLMVNGYKVNLKIVEDVLAEDIQIIKSSIYGKNGVDEIKEDVFRTWSDTFNTVIAGYNWIDCMSKNTDKKHALKEIQDVLHIAKEETMVFGDNYNDYGMFEQAEESYAVENACEELKHIAKHIAPPNTEDGVLQVLKQFLQTLE